MMIAVPVNQGTPVFERNTSRRWRGGRRLRVQTRRLEQVGTILVYEIRFAGHLALRFGDGLLDRRGPRLVRRHFSGELGQEEDDDTHQRAADGEARDAARLFEAVGGAVVHGRRECALP